MSSRSAEPFFLFFFGIWSANMVLERGEKVPLVTRIISPQFPNAFDWKY